MLQQKTYRLLRRGHPSQKILSYQKMLASLPNNVGGSYTSIAIKSSVSPSLYKENVSVDIQDGTYQAQLVSSSCSNELAVPNWTFFSLAQIYFRGSLAAQ